MEMEEAHVADCTRACFQNLDALWRCGR